jgi:hypothetical protein
VAPWYLKVREGGGTCRHGVRSTCTELVTWYEAPQKNGLAGGRLLLVLYSVLRALCSYVVNKQLTPPGVLRIVLRTEYSVPTYLDLNCQSGLLQPGSALRSTFTGYGVLCTSIVLRTVQDIKWKVDLKSLVQCTALIIYVRLLLRAVMDQSEVNADVAAILLLLDFQRSI